MGCLDSFWVIRGLSESFELLKKRVLLEIGFNVYFILSGFSRRFFEILNSKWKYFVFNRNG